MDIKELLIGDDWTKVLKMIILRVKRWVQGTKVITRQNYKTSEATTLTWLVNCYIYPLI